MTGAAQSRVRLADYRPPGFLIDKVDLDIRLDPEQTRVHTRLRIRQNPERPHVDTLVLDGEDLKLAAITLDGVPLARSEYVVTDRKLTIADAPDVPFELETVTIIDPSANTRLMGLYRSNGIYCTQCEAEGFRRITYFPDRPDILSIYTTRIEARKSDAPVLLGNGNPAATGEIPGSDRHFAVWHDPHPKPSYLFALVGGGLDVVADQFITMSGRRVRLGIYVEPGKEERASYAMEALKRSMAWDEQAFGREYDLDVFNIVAVSDFNMGAMENKGLNIFNDKYILASPETATDADYAHVEAVIAHEYFHNWTGNRITCRDWFQLCLKEGLTVFRDQEFTSDIRSRPVKRIADVRLLRTHQFVEDAGPLAHPVRPETYSEINNFYTATVYEKGAEVVRMIKCLLGPALFRAGMDRFFARYDGTAATVEEFVACFEDVSGRDLGRFSLWYSQAGTPAIVASGNYDAAARTYEMTLEQNCPPTPGQPSKEPMTIPVVFGLVGPDGQDMTVTAPPGAPVRGDLIEVTEARQTVTFTDVPARPVPSLLRGFSAPVKLDINLGVDELLFLAGADSDPIQPLAGRTDCRYPPARAGPGGIHRRPAARLSRRAVRFPRQDDPRDHAGPCVPRPDPPSPVRDRHRPGGWSRCRSGRGPQGRWLVPRNARSPPAREPGDSLQRVL
jgi:aminopeptidase N